MDDPMGHFMLNAARRAFAAQFNDSHTRDCGVKPSYLENTMAASVDVLAQDIRLHNKRAFKSSQNLDVSSILDG